jgi:hypothetical protein
LSGGSALTFGAIATIVASATIISQIESLPMIE